MQLGETIAIYDNVLHNSIKKNTIKLQYKDFSLPLYLIFLDINQRMHVHGAPYGS